MARQPNGELAVNAIVRPHKTGQRQLAVIAGNLYHGQLPARQGTDNRHLLPDKKLPVEGL